MNGGALLDAYQKLRDAGLSHEDAKRAALILLVEKQQVEFSPAAAADLVGGPPEQAAKRSRYACGVRDKGIRQGDLLLLLLSSRLDWSEQSTVIKEFGCMQFAVASMHTAYTDAVRSGLTRRREIPSKGRVRLQLTPKGRDPKRLRMLYERLVGTMPASARDRLRTHCPRAAEKLDKVEAELDKVEAEKEPSRDGRSVLPDQRGV